MFPIINLLIKKNMFDSDPLAVDQSNRDIQTLFVIDGSSW